MYLLDTNVVSEFRKSRPHGAVLAWMKTVPATHLYVSAVTVSEIQVGIEATRRQDPRKAAAIETWIDKVVLGYSILPIDSATFRIWAKLLYGQSSALYKGEMRADALIAATALRRKLTVVTRNVRDFECFKVPILNPFGG